MTRSTLGREIGVAAWLLSLTWAPPSAAGLELCATAERDAGAAARGLVEAFRESFAREVRIPDWCFASADDYAEVADRLVELCRERPEAARAEALAFVALKAGRCAGFEAGRRSTLGSRRPGPHFGKARR